LDDCTSIASVTWALVLAAELAVLHARAEELAAPAAALLMSQRAERWTLCSVLCVTEAALTSMINSAIDEVLLSKQHGAQAMSHQQHTAIATICHVATVIFFKCYLEFLSLCSILHAAWYLTHTQYSIAVRTKQRSLKQLVGNVRAPALKA
jgi:hypothetical protein